MSHLDDFDEDVFLGFADADDLPDGPRTEGQDRVR